jgi:predicted RNase H-like HicB family nuclease
MSANVLFERIFTGRDLTFNVQFQLDAESGWVVARVVELPGCVSQGATMAEARVNIADALESYLEVMFETAGSGSA